MKPRKRNLHDAMSRVTAGDTGKFEKGQMQFNEVISFLADMVTIGNDNPKWMEVYNRQEPYARAISHLIEDGHIDEAGNVLKWFGQEARR